MYQLSQQISENQIWSCQISAQNWLIWHRMSLNDPNLKRPLEVT